MSNEVEHYFSERATEFDRLYDLPPLERLVNRVFRRAIYQRWALTFQYAGDVRGRRVLDVGCGSGRYAVEFARRGASDVVGIDLAADMLHLAEAYARGGRVTEVCRFVRAEASEFLSDDPFDVVIAIGFFDYVSDPAAVLRHLRQMTTGRLLASFPAPGWPRSPLRVRRYARSGVKLRFYRGEEVALLAADAGFRRSNVVPLSAGHFLVAES